MISASILRNIPHIQPIISNLSQRYSLNSASLMASGCFDSDADLRHHASAAGRFQACDRLTPELIQEQCRLAAIRIQDLFIKHKKIELCEIRQLEKLGIAIFSSLLRYYRYEAPKTFFDPSQPLQGQTYAIDIFYLADMLDGIVGDFWRSDNLGNVWQVFGFITTEISISGAQLSQALSAKEQAIIAPYFRFMEEHIVLPWQKLCAAAAAHGPASQELCLVERIIPKLPEISESAHQRWSQLHPAYHGRRGSFLNAAVRHSSVRDFTMVQVFLWRCFLEGSLCSIEEELLLFARTIYRRIGIPWEMTTSGMHILVHEIFKCLDHAERQKFLPYCQRMMKLFPSAQQNLQSYLLV